MGSPVVVKVTPKMLEALRMGEGLHFFLFFFDIWDPSHRCNSAGTYQAGRQDACRGLQGLLLYWDLKAGCLVIVGYGGLKLIPHSSAFPGVSTAIDFSLSEVKGLWAWRDLVICKS